MQLLIETDASSPSFQPYSPLRGRIIGFWMHEQDVRSTFEQVVELAAKQSTASSASASSFMVRPGTTFHHFVKWSRARNGLRERTTGPMAKDAKEILGTLVAMDGLMLL
jgi:hypothetical protein